MTVQNHVWGLKREGQLWPHDEVKYSSKYYVRHVNICVHTHTCIHTWLHTRFLAHKCTGTYTYVYTRIPTHMYMTANTIPCTQVYLYVHICVHTHTNTYVHDCTHDFLHTSVPVRTHMCTHAYLNICTPVHIDVCQSYRRSAGVCCNFCGNYMTFNLHIKFSKVSMDDEWTRSGQVIVHVCWVKPTHYHGIRQYGVQSCAA